MTPYSGTLTKAGIYIGQNAGEIIDSHIKNATQSIRIISPYIVTQKYKTLIEKSRQNVQVSLLTSDDYRHFGDPEKSALLKHVVHQKRHIRPGRQVFRKWLRTASLLMVVLLTLTSAVMFARHGAGFLSTDRRFVFVPAFGLLSALALWNIQKRIRVYSYSYTTHFPIRFVVDPVRMTAKERSDYPFNAFFHVKLFIIDGEIAFLGSVNLTGKGMKHNCESCISIENRDEVSGLAEYFDDLFDQTYMQKDLSLYGKMIYKENPN